MDEDERDEDFSYELKQVQFSLGIGEGIALPPEPAYLDIARKFLQLPNVKPDIMSGSMTTCVLSINNLPIKGSVSTTRWYLASPPTRPSREFTIYVEFLWDG